MAEEAMRERLGHYITVAKLTEILYSLNNGEPVTLQEKTDNIEGKEVWTISGIGVSDEIPTFVKARIKEQIAAEMELGDRE